MIPESKLDPVEKLPEHLAPHEASQVACVRYEKLREKPVTCHFI